MANEIDRIIPQFPNGFKVTAPAPVDSRFILTKAQMKQAHLSFAMPNIYFCLCIEDHRLYCYNINNPDDPEIGRFVLAESELQAAFDAEDARAIAEDARLDKAIKDEESRALGAEEALLVLINDEIQARVEAVAAEKAARETADNTERLARIQADNDEIAARTAADDAERLARQESDRILARTIGDEAALRLSEDTAITNRLAIEENARLTKDNDLQRQIDSIESRSDVVDIVDTFADLQRYDRTKLSDNDILKVLTDEQHDGATSFWRYIKDSNRFVYVGSLAPYYTKSQVDDRLDNVENEIATKQENLVNQRNLKSINKQSLLGSGDIDTTPVRATEEQILALFEED